MAKFKIHESRIDTLNKKFENVNKRLDENSQMSFNVTGVSKDMYIDENGVKHNDGLYFEVETDGVAKLNGMEYLGKIDIIDGDRNMFRPYDDSKISKSDYDTISSMDGNQCACCGVNRKRIDMYAMRCTEDTLNKETGTLYKKGEIYSVGSSCVDKFVGVKALDIIKDLSGFTDMRVNEKATRDAKPVYIEPQRFMQYAMAIAKTNIDNMHAHYRKNRKRSDMTNDEWIDYAKETSNTYRKLTGQDDNKFGLIAKTALAAYNMYENNYVDKRIFADKESADMFDKMAKTVDLRKEIDSMKKLSECVCKQFNDEIETEGTLQHIIKGNTEALGNANFVHSSKAQLLVDVCDAYFLYFGSCAMHEETKPQYKITQNGNVIGLMRTDSGEKEVKIPNQHVEKFGINNKKLSRLFDGYPVILTNQETGRDIVATLDENKGLCQAKAFYKKENGKIVIDYDKVASVMPVNMPVNTRICYTSENLKIFGTQNKKIIDTSSMSCMRDGSVKGAGKFSIVTDDETFANTISNASDEIVDAVTYELGFDEDKSKKCKIVVSPFRENSFDVVFYNFPDNYKDYVDSRNKILEKLDELAYDSKVRYTSDKCKSISIDELSTFDFLKKEQPVASMNNIKSQTSCEKLNESLLRESENISEKEDNLNY